MFKKHCSVFCLQSIYLQFVYIEFVKTEERLPVMLRKPYQIICWTISNFPRTETILNENGEALTPNIQRGRPSISPEKKSLVTIWYIAHQDTIQV